MNNKYFIYVTVASFVANGGQLIDGTELYYSDDKKPNIDSPYTKFGWYDSKLNLETTIDTDMMIVRNAYKSWIWYKEFAFVKILCQPIWKIIEE